MIPSCHTAALALALVGTAAALPARADLPSGNFTGSARVTVAVDADYCRTGGVQCSAFGAPANGNTIPVAIRMQVLTPAGAPIGTLADANIAVDTTFVPAGGALVVKRSCTSCFQAIPGDGVYGVFVEPFRGQAWKSGTYYVQVQVTNGAFVARSLAEIRIPF